ncbi:hypothetical protein HAX54_031421, partial [Datura stramonium]|nr:hypothetical protein [Datura stramonium]
MPNNIELGKLGSGQDPNNKQTEKDCSQFDNDRVTIGRFYSSLTTIKKHITEKAVLSCNMLWSQRLYE